MIDRNVLIKYAELSKQSKDIEAELDTLKPQVLGFVDESDEKRITLTGYGDFYRIERKKWSYTDKVKELETAFKERKAEEEAKGIATNEVTYIFGFKGLRE